MVTIRDVAAEAGVSTATVSRVLSGVPTVDPGLAARVIATAERLGYRANRIAQALRRESTQTVGLIVPDITNPFFPEVIQAVQSELQSHGLNLLLCDSANNVGMEAQQIRNLIDHRVDGLLISVCDRLASRQAVQIAAGQVPLVQLDRRVAGSMHYVGVDPRGAIKDLVAHLLDQGCRVFSYISPSRALSTANDRLSEFVRQVRPVDPAVEQRILFGDFSMSWGGKAMARLLARGSRPDVVVCANDLLAAGAMETLRGDGIKVPRGILVTGFDDSILAQTSQPPLTTVRQPLAELGHEVVALLRRAIADPQLPPQQIRLPARLIVRQSSVNRRRPRPRDSDA